MSSRDPRALGEHHLIEYFGCDFDALNDGPRLRQLLIDAVRASGATIVTDVFHRFNPQGLSGVIVIAESHVAIHTWPEHGCASIDIFSCSEKMNVAVIHDALFCGLQASRTTGMTVDRAILPEGSDLQPQPTFQTLQ